MAIRAYLHVTVAVVLLAGCGPSGPPQEKMDEAKALVERCLEAWKNGGKPNQLATLTPAINFTDERWKGGYSLISYEVQRTYYDANYKMICCAVKLTLKDRRGRQRVEDAAYDVKLDSPITIALNPFS